MAYPHIVNPLSPEEKLCQEAVYYLSMLARLKRNDREEDESNGGVCEGDEIETTCNCCRGVVDVWTVHVSLKELFRFPRIQQLNASEDDIRLAVFGWCDKTALVVRLMIFLLILVVEIIPMIENFIIHDESRSTFPLIRAWLNLYHII